MLPHKHHSSLIRGIQALGIFSIRCLGIIIVVFKRLRRNSREEEEANSKTIFESERFSNRSPADILQRLSPLAFSFTMAKMDVSVPQKLLCHLPARRYRIPRKPTQVNKRSRTCRALFPSVVRHTLLTSVLRGKQRISQIPSCVKRDTHKRCENHHHSLLLRECELIE